MLQDVVAELWLYMHIESHTYTEEREGGRVLGGGGEVDSWEGWLQEAGC